MKTMYDPRTIEPKWQAQWEGESFWRAQDFSEKPKYYLLFEFPYPSGEGLHVGHVRPYTALDVMTRKLRMQGYNVLFPIGWDAFGLPTENFAIKHKIHPSIATKNNVDTFRRQMKMLGLSLDWSREVNTTDPRYYKWTQWIFLKLFEKGLAYKQKMWINWCPKCKIGLANEEVVNGLCERSGDPVEKREKEQWMLAITKYADRLVADLDTVDYLEKIKTQQINWIGRSEGAQVKFLIFNSQFSIEIFTTRLDTIYGCTYVVVAPEHELLKNLESRISNLGEVKRYVEQTKKKTDLERTELNKEKTGVFLEGIEVIHPFTGKRLPVYVADYVLATYGTGAVMGVPAHDERDFAFAKRYNLPIKRVIEPGYVGTTGEGAVKPNLEFVRRNAVCVVVRNPKDDAYLCVKWKTTPMQGLVTGGLEDGEDVIEAARREVREETGYKNLRLTWDAGISNHVKFFHRIKKVNRWARFQYVFFDLENEEKDPVSQEEASLHSVEWKKKHELQDFFSVFEAQFILKLLDNPEYIFTEDGILHNSGPYDWLDSEEAREKMILWLEEEGHGKRAVNYKLRDWVFSRQHYWGEPIPIIHCQECGMVPVPKANLPVELPAVEHYEPTDTGESPLSAMTEWVNVSCPVCGAPAKRETDTMPNWAGSSWYFLRYIDPGNDRALADPEKLKYWMPIDLYDGGMEHTTLHLLYSRFWNKFLYDIGVVPVSEPYARRRSHGLILAEGGQKMSKSKGNVVNPDQVVEEFGADALRLYELFLGPFSEAVAWSTTGVVGTRRFLEKVWRLQSKVQSPKSKVLDRTLDNLLHKTIKKVTEDIETLKFNTAISSLMICVNELEKKESISMIHYSQFLILLCPFAPHIAEELWQGLGEKQSIFLASWPVWDPKKIGEESVTVAVQINGKVRATLQVAPESSEAAVKELALADPKVVTHLKGRAIRKVIYVPGKILSLVV